GSISRAGQARMNVGQALDREAVLNDIELLTGRRPAGSRYDERKWSIALPQELTQAICALPGVRCGRRIDQAPALPEFVLDEHCPVAIVREFLGGLFGGTGTHPRCIGMVAPRRLPVWSPRRLRRAPSPNSSPPPGARWRTLCGCWCAAASRRAGPPSVNTLRGTPLPLTRRPRTASCASSCALSCRKACRSSS